MILKDKSVRSVIKIGCSLAITIPNQIVKQQGIKLKDHVRINVTKVKIQVKDDDQGTQKKL